MMENEDLLSVPRCTRHTEISQHEKEKEDEDLTICKARMSVESQPEGKLCWRPGKRWECCLGSDLVSRDGKFECKS